MDLDRLPFQSHWEPPGSQIDLPITLTAGLYKIVARTASGSHEDHVATVGADDPAAAMGEFENRYRKNVWPQGRVFELPCYCLCRLLDVPDGPADELEVVTVVRCDSHRHVPPDDRQWVFVAIPEDA